LARRRGSSAGCTRRVTDDSGDEGLFEPEPLSEDRRRAEWAACKSSRRLLISLSEAGVDLSPLVKSMRRLFVVCRNDGKAVTARERVSANARLRRQAAKIVMSGEVVYEIVAGFVRELGRGGEAAVCTEIRKRHPVPPNDVRGSLVGRSRTPSASPRIEPYRALGRGAASVAESRSER
jgi:hypothetical protein